MTRQNELILAGLLIFLAAAAALFWLPNDIDTGLFYTHRRQTYIGDALIPAICIAGIFIFSVAHFALIFFADQSETDTQSGFDLSYVLFCLALVAVLGFGTLIMFWAGPVAVALFGPEGDAVTYRQLRSTAPWNLIGYFLGGNVMLMGLAWLIEGRLSAGRVLSSVITVLVFIALFQGPIDGLLLPPNGDW